MATNVDKYFVINMDKLKKLTNDLTFAVKYKTQYPNKFKG